MKILSIGVGLICAVSLYGTAAAGETYYDAGAKALPLQQAAGTARATAMDTARMALAPKRLLVAVPSRSHMS